MLEKEEPEHSKKYYVNSTDVVAYKVNPWALELTETIVTSKKTTAFVTSKNLSLLDHDTGQIDTQANVVIGIKKSVDREEFLKVFEGVIYSVFDLSKSEKNVFKHLLKLYLNQKNNPQQVYLTYALLCDEYDYNFTKTTFLSGVNGLCIKGFIAPVENRDNLFWINPTLFYKGDRMRIVQDFVLEDRNKLSDIEKDLLLEDKMNEQ
jgi:hypothetical protein